MSVADIKTTGENCQRSVMLQEATVNFITAEYLVINAWESFQSVIVLIFVDDWKTSKTYKGKFCFRTKDQFTPWVFGLKVCFLQQGWRSLCYEDP